MITARGAAGAGGAVGGEAGGAGADHGDVDGERLHGYSPWKGGGPAGWPAREAGTHAASFCPAAKYAARSSAPPMWRPPTKTCGAVPRPDTARMVEKVTLLPSVHFLVGHAVRLEQRLGAGAVRAAGLGEDHGGLRRLRGGREVLEHRVGVGHLERVAFLLGLDELLHDRRRPSRASSSATSACRSRGWPCRRACPSSR